MSDIGNQIEEGPLVSERRRKNPLRMGDMVIYHHEHRRKTTIPVKGQTFPKYGPDEVWMRDYPAIVTYIRGDCGVDLFVMGLTAETGYEKADWMPESGNDVGMHKHDIPVCEVNSVKEGIGKGEWSRR